VSAAGAGEAPVPQPESWPEAPPHTEAGRLFTDLIIATFRLNGRLMEVAQRLATAGGLTPAWWQVLGGVLDEPRTVAEIGRRMGMTRQGVQRVADLLAERGLAEYRPNPSHRRAKLLACTEAGYWAIRRIALVQHPWANRVGDEVGPSELRAALATLHRLIGALEAEQTSQSSPRTARRREETEPTAA
jgi:DNA-binding MarR family transcriptional regulator